MDNPNTPPQSPVPIENPPVLPPTLTPQETAVMYGSVREKIMNASTVAGAIGGAIGGLVIGGIWSLVSGKTHWGRKTFGTGVVLSAVGAVASRITWGKDAAEKTVTQMGQQIEQLPPEQQAAAYQQIKQQLGMPQTSIHAETVTHQAPQMTAPVPEL